MSKLGGILDEFRAFKNNPPKRSGLATPLQGLRKNVVVPVPVMRDPVKRFNFMTLCLQLVWSARSSGAFITGAFMSLLSMFAENPGSMIRGLVNDPDIDVQLAEISDVTNDRVVLATRGRGMEKYETEIYAMAEARPEGEASSYPYQVKNYQKILPKSTEDLQLAIQTVTAQIWILLTKAVTAIDTARDSEARRWIKYEQQRRADAEYKLSDAWLNFARIRIASDLAIRRYMVEILINANKAPSPKARVIELICDIGNYVSEAGMAGFFLTIKYGIETKYPALALNELQADLATVLSLMRCYVELGERAPYMVILEDSVQTKFSPGAYPLLWSYAMGVGCVLDRAVNNLKDSRNYLEQNFYNLGIAMVEKMEGSVNRQITQDLGLTEDQIAEVKELVRLESEGGSAGTRQGPRKSQSSGKFDPTSVDPVVPDSDEEESDDDTKRRPKPKSRGAAPRTVTAYPGSTYSPDTTSRTDGKKPTKAESAEMRNQLAGILKAKPKDQTMTAEEEEEARRKYSEGTRSSDDMSAINS
ncbi:nucleocapsid protein [Longquan Niviventer fulvescens jeilongvirus 2]|uniref:Nucleocapsid n=1 Tax=Longquan Niviventer fulvescens jeilongvirus 2 TaxID=2877482 RepID=A0AAE9BVK5_9MONO|nr:nucleocapsid protein [Longquan Niviventer fulvescens jeilongvirus 2]